MTDKLYEKGKISLASVISDAFIYLTSVYTKNRLAG